MLTATVVFVSLMGLALHAWMRIRREERTRRTWLWCNNKREYLRLYGPEEDEWLDEMYEDTGNPVG